jgi:selenobiotic family peptide radical SAM maturase
MASAPNEDLSRVYPHTWARLPQDARRRVVSLGVLPDDLPHHLPQLIQEYGQPEYLQEMAELEAALWECRRHGEGTRRHPGSLCVNPTLSVIQVQRKGLLELLGSEEGDRADAEQHTFSEEEGTGLVWWDPFRGRVRLEPARNEDLLILKMVAEGIDARELAAEHGLSTSRLYTLLQRGGKKGLLLGPASRLQRPPEVAPRDGALAEAHLEAEIFTLQWHLTDACDMHCRHCYGGGGARSHVDRETAFRVLRETAELCREKNVRGQITFTGGNPLLHPHFFEVYEAAVKEGFLVAILGNPTDQGTLDRLAAIEPPVLFQVSLEGLREHNDFIRQQGHYERVLGFLDRLGEYGIPSQVMLTLTRANMDQVLPLGEVLRDRADRFTFNRISLVGEGAALHPPDPASYRTFLGEYLEAARKNPVLRLKDNMLNPALAAEGADPFGGCTGFGCGAAFNFMALLSNGEVHACRKFPSPIGDNTAETLARIYDSQAASAYRSAPQACLDCSLCPVCRGCPAVVHSFGGNVFRDRDPYCPGPISSHRPG